MAETSEIRLTHLAWGSPDQPGPQHGKLLALSLLFVSKSIMHLSQQ